jgi:hypothetical protein
MDWSHFKWPPFPHIMAGDGQRFPGTSPSHTLPAPASVTEHGPLYPQSLQNTRLKLFENPPKKGAFHSFPFVFGMMFRLSTFESLIVPYVPYTLIPT